MNLGPMVRIGLRYGVGYLLGSEVGGMLAADPDIVILISLGLGVVIESAYSYAKKKGWST